MPRSQSNNLSGGKRYRDRFRSLSNNFGGSGLSPFQSLVVEAWPLSETSGARAGIVAGYTLTDNNTVSYGGSIVSNARSLDGSTQYFTTPNASAYQLNSGSYTVMSWGYKISNAATGCMFSKRSSNGSADWEYLLYSTSTGALQFSTTGNAAGTSVSVSTSSSQYALKTWNMALAWYDSVAEQIDCSINNSIASTGAASTTGKTPTTNTAEVVFGAIRSSATPTYTNFWNGRLGAQAAFSGVLTSDEKTTLYNGGYQLRYDQLPASLAAKCVWWVPFDQTSGNETDSVTSAAITATGSPTYRCGIYQTAQSTGSARFVLANSEYLSRTGGTMAGIDSISTNFSIEIAARFDTASMATQSTLFGKGATADAIRGIWINKGSSDRPQATIGNGTSRVTVNPTNVVTVGSLQHWVITVDRSGNMIVYVNGSLGTGTASASIAAISGDLGTINLTMGGLSGFTFCEAEMGLVRFYNTVLSSTQVSYLYNSGALRSYSNL